MMSSKVRRIVRADVSSPPNGDLNQQRVMYYNDQWQLLEEFINDDWDELTSDPEDHDRRMQYVWGVRYIDDIALRRQWVRPDWLPSLPIDRNREWRRMPLDAQ